MMSSQQGQESMTSVKYTQLPMADGDESLTFDYSSPFSFDDNSDAGWKYRSAFTYNGTSSSKLKVNEEREFKADRLIRLLITIGFSVIFVMTFPIMVWFSFKRLSSTERLVVFRLGRLHKAKGPGLVFVLPLLDRYQKVDVKLRAFSVPPKQIITGDGGIIEVGAEIYFQIMDAEKSVTNVQNLNQSTRVLLQTSLCNILSQKSLSEIEAERRTIADALMAKSNKTCLGWGVEISRAELSQIKVLSEPPAKKSPTLMMPPGLCDIGSGSAGSQSSMPSALIQLASAFMAPNGPQQSQAITEALHTLTKGGLTPVEKAEIVLEDSKDLEKFLCSDSSSEMAKKSLPELSPPVLMVTPQSVPTLLPGEILASIQDALCPSLVEKIGSSYQFDIIGPGGGTYYLDLEHGGGSVGEGSLTSGEPAATLIVTFEDLQAMLGGQLKPFQAYMSGRLRISGDVGAALKLEELGKRMQDKSGATYVV